MQIEDGAGGEFARDAVEHGAYWSNMPGEGSAEFTG
jgi:hypothetical protein